MSDDFEPMDYEHCTKCGSYKGPFYDGLCPCCGEPSEAGEGIGRAVADIGATASTQDAQGGESAARSESRCIDCGSLTTLGRLCNRCFAIVKL